MPPHTAPKSANTAMIRTIVLLQACEWLLALCHGLVKDAEMRPAGRGNQPKGRTADDAHADRTGAPDDLHRRRTGAEAPDSRHQAQSSGSRGLHLRLPALRRASRAL